MAAKTIFNEITANSTTAAKAAFQFASEENSRPFSLYLVGVWNGATATMQITPDSGDNWLPLLDINAGAVVATSNEVNLCNIKGTHVRGVITNAGSLTSLTCLVL